MKLNLWIVAMVVPSLIGLGCGDDDDDKVEIKMDPTPWLYGGPDNKDWQEPRPLPSESCR